MKILLISTAIEGGGAANACLRLYLALRQMNADVRLLVLKRPKGLQDLADDERITFLEDSWQYRLFARLSFVLERLEVLWHNGFNRKNLWQYSTASFGLDLARHEWVEWADVVHLQWINHGTLSLHAIKQIQSLNKLVVWTLHDLWALTGLAHLPSIGAEPLLLFSDRYARQEALTLGQEHRKAFIYRRRTLPYQSKINFVAVSSFVSSLAKQLLVGQAYNSLEVIAPALDIKRDSLSEELQNSFPWYDANQHYLLISAARLDDPIKGANFLIHTTKELCRIYPEVAERTNLLLLGSIKNKTAYKEVAINTIELGHIREREVLQNLFSLADITLSTSLFETFGLTLVESLAMGTPVLSFDCGGARDIIKNGVNGYIVAHYDCGLMAEQITKLLSDIKHKRITAEMCQASILPFRAEAIAQQHIDYYQRLLNNNE